MAEGSQSIHSGRWRTRWTFEWFSTVVIGLATFCTGWCTYQNARWGGTQAHEYAVAAGGRVIALRTAEKAQLDALLDVSLFTQWLTATAAGEQDAAEELHRRFPPRLGVPFDEWRSKAAPGGFSPGSPFQSPDYNRAARDEIYRLDASVEEHAIAAARSNFMSTTYVLPIGLSSMVLAISGIALKLQSKRAQRTLGGVAGALLVVALSIAVWLWLEGLEVARIIPA